MTLSWNRPLIIGSIVLLLFLVWLQRDAVEQKQLHRSQLMMGTIIEMVALGEDNEVLETGVNAAFAEMARLDKLLSRHYDDSDVTILSQSKSGAKVAPETAEVIALGLDVARQSAGAFDMTLGRLKALWGFTEENPSVPGQDVIVAALEFAQAVIIDATGRQ